MAARRFPLYPLSILCAVAGSVMICALSKILCEKPNNTFVSCIAYLGRWSLYLFAVHSVDAVWLAFWHSAGWREVLLRVACDVAVFYGVMVWFDPKIRNAMFSRMHV